MRGREEWVAGACGRCRGAEWAQAAGPSFAAKGLDIESGVTLGNRNDCVRPVWGRGGQCGASMGVNVNRGSSVWAGPALVRVRGR